MPLLAALLALAPEPLADLPFERVGNRIYLKGTLNGKPANAVLDTGAATTVADDVLGFAAGAKRVQAISAGGAGAKTLAAWVVSGLDLKLVGTEIAQPVQVVLPLAPLTAMEGRPLETILGTDFLQRYRVEIQYERRRVRIFDAKDDSVPAGAALLPFRLVANQPVVKGRIDLPGVGPKDVTMLLDTGATTAANLTGRLVERLRLDDRFKDLPEIVTGAGVGGETKGRRVRLASLSLGDARLDRPVATVESTDGGATGRAAGYDVLVGGEALRRFDVTLDYAHKRIFLVPNRSRGEAFVGDRTGLAVALGEGGFVVRSVFPRSPAEEAGVLPGDVLLSLDGVAPASLDELRQKLRAATGDQTLRLRRAGVERETVLKPRETVP